MNQRIQQLAEQAGLQLGTVLENYTTPVKTITVEQKKFAELIVQECAAIADDGFGSAHFGLGISGKMLTEHFGVDK